MQSMALEQRPDGSVFIFFHGQQYRREPNGSWTKRMHDKWKTVSSHHARRLKRVDQHRDEIKQVQRFPRPEPERRITELIQQVFISIADRRKANIEIGLACVELKELVGHGKWIVFFEKTFSKRLNLRTAERYMRLAQANKFDKVSNFQTSNSKRARKMRKATEQAKAEVRAVGRRDPASIIERTINALRRSSHWHIAAPEIIAYLRQLCSKYGVVIATKNTEGSTAA
jgi:Protein of unknown function (DUF3102)